MLDRWSLSFSRTEKLPLSDVCPRLPEEIGLSMPISSPFMRKARCFERETITCALSGVMVCRTALLVTIGGCLEISSLAFFIGCIGVGDGLTRFGNCGAFAAGEATGRGGGVRLGTCAFASETKAASAAMEIRQRKREITLIQLPTYVSTRFSQPGSQRASFRSGGELCTRFFNTARADSAKLFVAAAPLASSFIPSSTCNKPQPCPA